MISLCVLALMGLSQATGEGFTNCGGELTELPEAAVRTPQYPTKGNQESVYPSNSHCEWWFKGDEKTLIRFKVWDLSVQLGEGRSNVTCDFDYVEIHIDSIGSRRLCGHNTPDDEIRGKGSFRIVFVSDDTKNFRGLSGSYQITEDFDPCEPNPCSQHGTCQIKPDLISVICLCAPGFTGKQCEIDIDECQSRPCQNGGTCNEKLQPDHYRCECIIGYEGYNCETKIDHPCIPDPCQFGGTCYNHTESSYSCECPQNRTGNNCEEENFAPCTSYPCQNGGTCHDITDEQKYLAVPPPLGSNEEPKDVPRPIEYLGFNCTCLDEYRGQLCEIDAGCSDPGIPDLAEGYWFDANSVVTFSCSDGYYMEGQANVTCFHNGTWSSDIPRCNLNESAIDNDGSMSVWAVSMISLGIALFVDLAAFLTWLRLEKPWAPQNRILNIAQGEGKHNDNETCYSESETASAYTSQSCSSISDYS